MLIRPNLDHLETVLCIYRNAKILLGYCDNCKAQSFIHNNRLLCCQTVTGSNTFKKIIYLEDVKFNEEERIKSLSQEVLVLQQFLQHKKKYKRALQRKMPMELMEQKASKELKILQKKLDLNNQEVLKIIKKDKGIK